MLRVSINSDLGRELGQRYGFRYTPEFIVFDARGTEIYRGASVPTLEQVLQ